MFHLSVPPNPNFLICATGGIVSHGDIMGFTKINGPGLRAECLLAGTETEMGNGEKDGELPTWANADSWICSPSWCGAKT